MIYYFVNNKTKIQFLFLFILVYTINTATINFQCYKCLILLLISLIKEMRRP